MFWADKLADEITKAIPKTRKGGPFIIRDEKTPSGRVHVGSMRGVALHATLSEVLEERGKENTFLYEFNDMDPMDGFPVYLPEEFRKYMGMPLMRIPSPDGKAKNFAEYFSNEFKEVIAHSGFSVSFYNVSELYLSGKMDEAIRVALDNASEVRRIYKEISGSQKGSDWYPLSVICEKCGKVGTTEVYAWDGKEVSYRCKEDLVTWARGCGNEGKLVPFGGTAKFPFKVEWGAKWSVIGVDIEGAGKDHMTKGGAHDVAKAIAESVFKIEAPFDFAYEFFLVGGKKMSSSKGKGSSAKDIAELVPPKIFRLALLSKDIKQAFNFDPDGETIPTLYDLYDTTAEKFFSGEKDDFARLFELSHPKGVRKNIPNAYRPRFSIVSFIVQMPHLNFEEEVAKMKGSALTAEDKAEAHEREEYARTWLTEHAPEKYRFELKQDGVPEVAKNLSELQKSALAEILQYIAVAPSLDGQKLHERLHALKDELSIEPKELFSAIYLSFLGKESGPKAGWFLSVLPKDFLIKRLQQVSS